MNQLDNMMLKIHRLPVLAKGAVHALIAAAMLGVVFGGISAIAWFASGEVVITARYLFAAMAAGAISSFTYIVFSERDKRRHDK